MVYEKDKIVYEKDGKIYYDRINDCVKRSRDFFINVGSNKQIRNKSEISEEIAANFLYCNRYFIKILIKHGFLHSDCFDGENSFCYEWIEDFAKDNRFLDEYGNLPEKTGYDSEFYTDNQGRMIVIPLIKWIDKNGNETENPTPKSPPVSYVQLICINGEKHCHTMGVGGRAEGYYLKPSPKDIALIKQYNLKLGDQYKDLY